MKIKNVSLTLLAAILIATNTPIAQAQFIELCPNPNSGIGSDEPSFIPCSELENSGMSDSSTENSTTDSLASHINGALNLLKDKNNVSTTAVSEEINNSLNDINSLKESLESKMALNKVSKVEKFLNKALNVIVTANTESGINKKKISRTKKLLKKSLRLAKRIN